MMLETERLILRQPVEADIDAWAAFDADPVATRFFGGPKDRAEAWNFLARVAGMWALRGCGVFSVFEKTSGCCIGRIGPHRPEGATAEVGWALLPTHWGKGYATEGARAAIDWAVDHLGWSEIAHCIDADNAPSIAVAHRLGARWLRVARDSHGGPTQVYGQTAQDWRARR
ncbi:MAG: GNAT family N-acetyltransferase [Rhizomicrobium sp.]